MHLLAFQAPHEGIPAAQHRCAPLRSRTASDEQGVRLAVEDARAVADELQEMIARLDEGASSRLGPSGR
jgi:hypothetical protein